MSTVKTRFRNKVGHIQPVCCLHWVYRMTTDSLLNSNSIILEFSTLTLSASCDSSLLLVRKLPTPGGISQSFIADKAGFESITHGTDLLSLHSADHIRGLKRRCMAGHSLPIL